jgi:hypothetical protein
MRALARGSLVALGFATACGRAPVAAVRPAVAPVAESQPAPTATSEAEAAPPSGLYGRAAWAKGAPRRISGIVTVAHEPVRAHVALHPRYAAPGSMPVIQAEAGDDGRFDLGERPLHDYVLVAWRDDTAPTMLPLDIAVAAPLEGIEIPLMPCLRRVFGTVADRAGAPIAGATVQEQPHGPVVTTDAAGHYELCVSDVSAYLGFAAGGHGSVKQRVSTLGIVQHDVTLEPEATIEGVVRGPDGAPVPGVLVSSQSIAVGATPETMLPRAAISDAAGRYVIAGLVAPGRVILGGMSATHGSTLVPVEVDAPIRYTRDLRLEPGVRVAGRVTGPGGAPVQGAQVAWRVPRAINNDSALTAADGSFVLDGVAAGELVAGTSISVWQHEITALIAAKDGGLEGFELQVRPLPQLRGRVVHDGRPVAGASVFFGAANRMLTATDGTFAIPHEHLSPGRLWAYSEPLLAFGRHGEVGGDAGIPAGEIEIDLVYRSSATGILVDETGAPIAGAYLSVANASKTDFSSAFTGPDGTFHIMRMRGGESYDVTVYTSGERLNVYPAARGAKTSFAVKDGRTDVTGLRIEVRREPTAAKP